MYAKRPVPRHPWWFAALLPALLMAGCAGSPAEPTGEQPEALEDILSQPLDAEEYGEPRRCISEYAYRDFEPLGERLVVFEGPGGRLWLNELRGRCPGLDRASSLAFRSRGFQLCELDQFKVTDVFAWERYQRWPWRWMDGIPCTLGKFQPISTEQLEALRATLR